MEERGRGWEGEGRGGGAIGNAMGPILRERILYKAILIPACIEKRIGFQDHCRIWSAMNPVLGFLRRNIVLVVTIPSIIGLHYGWYRLQFNENFVPKEEKVKVLGIDVKGLEKSKSSWVCSLSTVCSSAVLLCCCV